MRRMLRGLGWTFGMVCLFSMMGCFLSTTSTPGPDCQGDSDCTSGNICTGGECRPDNAPAPCNGDLRIVWEFNGAEGCPSDVDEIIIKVFTPNGARIHKNPQGDPVSCSSGSRTFSSLECGTYQIQVQAVDVDDAITWSAPQAPIDVINDNTAEATANLRPE